MPDQGRAGRRLGAARGRARAGDRRAGGVLARRDAARTTPRCSRRCERDLPEHDTDGLQIEILPVAEATRFTLERAKRGEDTISVTGNVLRDYLTDLFPILELGTSAKMLSIVPLMNGGGLFETGAGGSAPKHVQQLVKENHLRWDSLGEFLALAVSLELLADKDGNAQAAVLARRSTRRPAELLENGKSPARKVGELDNRGSHYYLARYWARGARGAGRRRGAGGGVRAAGRAARGARRRRSSPSSTRRRAQPVDLGGYYHVDRDKATAAMRPSATFNDAIASAMRGGRRAARPRSLGLVADVPATS